MNLIELRNGWTEFIDDWFWELYATIIFPHELDLSHDSAQRICKNWLRGIKTYYQNRIRIGAMLLSVTGRSGYVHLHVPMVSSPTYPFTLSSVKKEYLEMLCHYNCVIRHNQNRRITFGEYLSLNRNMRLEEEEDWDFSFYNLEFLRSLKGKHLHGHDRMTGDGNGNFLPSEG